MTSNISSSYDYFKIIDDTVVDSISKQANGDKQFVSMLFESFIAEGNETLIMIETALKNNDYKTIGEVVHALKGLAGTMGVSQVFELCKDIDAALKQSNINEAMRLLPLLKLKYQVANDLITANYLQA